MLVMQLFSEEKTITSPIATRSPFPPEAPIATSLDIPFPPEAPIATRSPALNKEFSTIV